MKSLLLAFAALLALSMPAFADARSERASDHFGIQLVATQAPNWRRGAPAIVARATVRAGERVYAVTSSVVAEALRYDGSGKFTPYPGPWCADATSAWLVRAGKPPLPGRMASAALAYGPRGSGRPGELAVFLNRRGYAYHVGVVVADLGSQVEIISGNWSHRVARAVVPRWGLVFIRT